jgi:predicted nucleic acid-binding protein
MLADSSFYLCFLEDIKQPEVLKRILGSFKFLITPIVYDEVSKSENFKHIGSNPRIILLPKENFGEVLRPFFSKKEIEKGETEVIEVAYQFYADGNPRMFILDDKEPRLFVMRNLPYLVELMIGTIGFIGRCSYEYEILEKNEASAILLVISTSTFRVEPEIISEVLAKINSR